MKVESPCTPATVSLASNPNPTIVYDYSGDATYSWNFSPSVSGCSLDIWCEIANMQKLCGDGAGTSNTLTSSGNGSTTLTIKHTIAEMSPTYHGTWTGVIKAKVNDNPASEISAPFTLQVNDPCTGSLVTVSKN